MIILISLISTSIYFHHQPPPFLSISTYPHHQLLPTSSPLHLIYYLIYHLIQHIILCIIIVVLSYILSDWGSVGPSLHRISTWQPLCRDFGKGPAEPPADTSFRATSVQRIVCRSGARVISIIFYWIRIYKSYI